MRVAGERRRRELRPGEGGLGARAAVAAGDALDGQALGQDLAHGHARGEAGVGVLEDILHAAAQRRMARRPRRDRSWPSNRTAPAVGSIRRSDGAADGGLAAAGFADQADHLAAARCRRRRRRRTAHRGGAALRVVLGEAPGRRAGARSCRRARASGGSGCGAGATGSRAGTAARQGSMASGQRGAKAQPGGRAISGGTVPGMVGRPWPARRRVGGAEAGHRAIRPGCRGGGACGRRRATAPSSTTRPAYITATRSAISATTPRLWVTKSMAMPRSRCRRLQQVEDLGLDGDVESGGGLVGDQQRRVAGERHGDQ